MLGLICLYALIGFLLDLLITFHVKAVASQQPARATILSVLITLVSVLLIQNLIVNFSLPLVIAYALGTGGGTALGMYAKRIKEFLRRW